MNLPSGMLTQIFCIFGVISLGSNLFFSHSVVFFLKSSNQKFTEKAIRDKKEYAEIVNGSQVLPDTLFEKCQKFRKFSYQLGARVTSLSEKGKRITVGFTVGRKRDKNIQGHYAIVTATAREVSLMKFQPPLPYMKLNAVRSLEYLGSVKVFLKFKTAFWAEENKIPRIRYNDPEKKNGATAMSDEECIERALEMMVDRHGEIARDQFETGVVKKWQLDNFAHGAFVMPYVFQASELIEHLRAPHGNVIFSGEYTSKYNHGWVEAALDSAVQHLVRLWPEEYNRRHGSSEKEFFNKYLRNIHKTKKRKKILVKNINGNHMLLETESN